MSDIGSLAIDSLIRPKRQEYNESDLKLSYLIDGYGEIQRIPTLFRNFRNLKIVGSLYQTNKWAKGNPCLIYLHGNSGSQLEGRYLVKIFIPLGISVFCFDFAGSGNSEGDFVSLGYYEKYDVTAAMDYLREKHDVNKIIIWGRSMGAVTGIFSLSIHQDIAAAVLDSPFATLHDEIFALADEYHLRFILSLGLYDKIRNTALEKANFNVDDVNPIHEVPNCFSPLFLIHAKDDTTIPIDSSLKIFEEYLPKVKQFHVVEGDHYTDRPISVIKEATEFICESLGFEITFED